MFDQRFIKNINFFSIPAFENFFNLRECTHPFAVFGFGSEFSDNFGSGIGVDPLQPYLLEPVMEEIKRHLIIHTMEWLQTIEDAPFFHSIFLHLPSFSLPCSWFCFRFSVLNFVAQRIILFRCSLGLLWNSPAKIIEDIINQNELFHISLNCTYRPYRTSEIVSAFF